ncbi:uncharacterized protein [Panulirus ornatus]|uniref:uncharacterized protein isoform X2 n=1 Tax=Panulirus ornatus TaxID=150431 RepID=UPI003A8BDB32
MIYIIFSWIRPLELGVPGQFANDATWSLKRSFKEDLYAPMIDAVNMDTIMLVDEAGHVGGKVTFTEDLNLLDGLSSDSNVLDGRCIAELQNGAIWKDEGDVTVDSDVIVDTLIIEGNVKASADITAVEARNKVDVKHFLNSLVLKSSDQSITDQCSGFLKVAKACRTRRFSP